ncbi:hypothetical protein CL658_01085 [bacterium]|nr:hypothetical protein [bacterium]
MKSPIIRLLMLLKIIIYLSLGGCGKVVHKATSDTGQTPTFSLSIIVKDIVLAPKETPITPNITPTLLLATQELTPKFSHKNPIFMSLKGYKKNKAHDLAWGKGIITSKTNKSNKYLNTKPSPNYKILESTAPTPSIEQSTISANKAPSTTTYTGTLYDKKKIKVTTAKQSQFQGTFKQSKKEWEFTTNHVKKTYDYYLTVIYESSTMYHMSIIDQTIVSSNKKVALETDHFNTFKAIIFINAFRTLEFDNTYYDTINIVFDQPFFESLNYVFPKLNNKELSKKTPTFKVSDPIIEECIKILELSVTDPEESQAYIPNLNKKYFTESQKKILLNNINELSKAPQ